MTEQNDQGRIEQSKKQVSRSVFSYASVCSGIEAGTVAWEPLGWQPAFFSEVAPFPSALLAHRYPDTENVGDMTMIGAERGPVDLLVGGTPCQSFSVAGLRRGMADVRGNLALVFLGLACDLGARWVVWENVPGVLSSSGGRDFGAFIRGLDELRYGFAWRTLDAQYFGVPQRRRRVFVVGYLGDWRRAAAVLFERQSLSGDSPPCREAGSAVAALTAAGVGVCGADDNQAQAGHLVADPITASYAKHGGCAGGKDSRPHSLITHALSARHDSSEDGSGRGTPLVLRMREGAVAFAENTRNELREMDMSVRRLTPRECERLQGFPDGYTLIPYRSKPAEKCPDSPRYAALGNSMAVPVMRWIGERIAKVEATP